MGKRKIIQIAATCLSTSTRSKKVLYALCDDGTVWQRDDNQGSNWVQIEEIPNY